MTPAQLIQSGHRFSFYQAVRVLERMAGRRGVLGKTGRRPGEEPVRFQPVASLSHPAGEVQRIEVAADRSFRCMTTFFGLYGFMGILPRSYTGLISVRDTVRAGRTWPKSAQAGLKAFLDIFNHRTLSLFYRASSKYRFHLRWGEDDADTHFRKFLRCLAGIETPGLRDRLAFPDLRLFEFLGLLCQHPRSELGVETLLSAFFDRLPIRVRSFLERTVLVPPGQRTRLGDRRRPRSLGKDLMIGSKVRTRSMAFRVRIGVLGLPDFSSLLPREEEHARLWQLIRVAVCGNLDFDIQLGLQAAEIPKCSLARGARPGPRLGQSAWLLTRDATQDSWACILRSAYWPGVGAAESVRAPTLPAGGTMAGRRPQASGVAAS